MCGIAGVYLRDENAKGDLDAMLSTMLDEIEHRGGDATGFVALGNEGVTEWQKASCDASDFNRNRRPVPKGTRTVLGHTRWATQGLPAFPENNHPLRRGSFFIIHNGHVSNDYKLFELAGRTGYGQVDSEAIAARLASLGKLGKAGKMMAEIVGAAAIAAVDETKPGELVLARGHSSPLYVLTTKRYVLWGSTHKTIVAAYTKHIGRLPKKAKIQMLPEGTMWHFVNGTLTKSKFKPYSPPMVTKKLGEGFAWKATTTEISYPSYDAWKSDRDATPEGGYVQLSPAGSLKAKADIGLDDIEDCDGCGDSLPWTSLDYVQDDGITFQLCGDCTTELEHYGPENFWAVVNAGTDLTNIAKLHELGEDED